MDGNSLNPQEATKSENQNGTTNRTVEKEHRKKRLVRKSVRASKAKYYAWLGGHASCVLFGTITLIFQAFWLPNVYYVNSVCYRLCLLGASVALLATLSHKFSLHYLPPFTTLLAQHNFQYLVLAVIWCFTFRSFFKIMPLYLISILQLSELHKFKFVQKHADTIASFIGFDEIFLILYLLVRTVAFRSTSGYQMSVLVIFVWLRILFDPDTAKMFMYVVDKADFRVSQIKNEKVSKVWTKFKRFLDDKLSAKFY